ncbi:MAG: PAS domain S-box protein [Syntrophales bacterium]
MDKQGKRILVVEDSRELTQIIEELERERSNLQESELRMRSIACAAQDAILMMDSAGRVSYWNPAAERILGYTEAEAIGQNLHSLLAPPRYQAAHQAAFPTFIQTGQGAAVGKTLDLAARRKDGKEIAVQLSLSAIKINSDWHAVGILRDITGRKRMESELSEAHQDLEKKVQERTLELGKTNTALTVEIEERKMLNTTLKNVAAYNRNLFESNIDPFVTISLEGKFTDANHAVEVVTGFSRDELIGMDWTDYFTDPDAAQAGFQKVFSQGELRDYELQLRHRNGKIIPVLCNGSLYHDESGKVIGVLGVARDITERKIAEWALKESEQRYRIIADNTYDWEFWLSPQYDIFYTSPSCERITGHLPQEFQQNKQLMLEIVHPDDLPGFEEHFYAEYKKDYSGLRETEFRIIHKDGTVRWLGHLCQPVFSDSGAFIGIRGSNRDITDKKQAEEVLRKSEARFKHLLQDVQTVAVQGYAPDGTTQYWNQAAEQFYGYTAEEAIGRNLLDLLIPPEMRGDVEQAIRQMAETGQPIPAAELSLMRKDGSRLAVFSSHTIVQIPGQKQELFCIDIDMTDRKQAEQDRVAREVAEKANQAKSIFVANMSHEIRTPMNAVIGFAQVLERDPAITPEQAEHVRTIHRSGIHLLRLINDILDMSKIEAGRTTLNEAVFCLHDLLDDLLQMFRVRTDAQGLQLLMERDENVPRYVNGDEGKLRQVLVNLLGNAVKFTATGGVAVRVRVGAVAENTGEADESLRLGFEVEDSGPGIPDEEQNRIFDPFQQGGGGMASGGTGLGLAISRRFVEMMGGSLAVKSKVGTGSCFGFDLLLKPAAEVAGREQRVSRRIIGLEAGSGPFRILVVDDAPTNRVLLCALLRPLGFEVAEAGNGVEAIDIFKKWSPHAVLMDMRMPVMDGYEATRWIKSTEAGRVTPVIAITANAFENNGQRVMESGVDAYVRKPFRMEEICAALGKCLGVRYLFADGTDETLGHPAPVSLTPEALAALPQEMIRAMRQALEEGDSARLRELIAQVENLDSPTARELQALLDRYDYGKLGEWLASSG